jgi:small subunit ribosomal protein S17
MADEQKQASVDESTQAGETTEETPVVEETTPEAPAATEAPATEAPATEAESEQVEEGATVAEPAAEEKPAAEEVVPDVPEAAAEELPVTEGEAAVEDPGPAPADETPSAAAKRPRKRLARPLRRQRPKAPRGGAAAGGRKPIVRLEKPEAERGRRQERQGTVVSAVQDKTIVVQVATVKAHPRYKKVVRRSKRFHAHDERNVAKVGDVVRIVETRPLSKLKRWRLAEVLEEAK